MGGKHIASCWICLTSVWTSFSENLASGDHQDLLPHFYQICTLSYTLVFPGCRWKSLPGNTKERESERERERETMRIPLEFPLHSCWRSLQPVICLLSTGCVRMFQCFEVFAYIKVVVAFGVVIFFRFSSQLDATESTLHEIRWKLFLQASRTFFSPSGPRQTSGKTNV